MTDSFTLHDFVQQALRTESKIEHFTAPRLILEEALESYIAAGNMLDQLKKHAYYGSDFDLPKYSRTMEQLAADLLQSADALYTHLKDHGIHNIHETTMLNVEPRTAHALIGMNTESAEIAEAFLKYLRGEKLDVVNVFEEVADHTWYSSILADEYKVNPYQPLINVVDKLRKRYPDKFSQTAAEQRDLDAERSILTTNI